jgi:hypothetical protein
VKHNAKHGAYKDTETPRTAHTNQTKAGPLGVALHRMETPRKKAIKRKEAY